MPCRYVAQACRAATLKQGAVTSAATRRNSSRSMPDASAVSASILLLARLKNLRNEGRPNEGWPCQTVSVLLRWVCEAKSEVIVCSGDVLEVRRADAHLALMKRPSVYSRDVWIIVSPPICPQQGPNRRQANDCSTA